MSRAEAFRADVARQARETALVAGLLELARQAVDEELPKELPGHRALRLRAAALLTTRVTERLLLEAGHLETAESAALHGLTEP